MVSGVDYVQAIRRRPEPRPELQAAIAGLDGVPTAAAFGEAPKLDAVPLWDLFGTPGFTMPFNVVGCPATSVRTGFGSNGLPLSL